MRKHLMLVVCLLAASQLLVAQQPLPITRVLLYKNGMAYIVRSGQLSAPVSLTFHPEDMNDVLKSFSAWNPDSGGLYSVGYTAGVPSGHMLGRFPFDLASADAGLGTFLTQVKGAAVRLSMGASTIQGVLAAVQRTDRVVSQQTSTYDHRLTIQLRNGSLQTVWLNDVRSVDFVDPQLRDQLKAYLEVLAEVRQDVTREISIYPVPAAGPVRVAYLQQFPLWKTSYRVDLADRESRIQGWAQIDNPTGESWNNVEVSLLSGSPVSFIMNLYDPLYTNRSTVGVPGAQVAGPRQYEAAVRTAPNAVARVAPPVPAPAGGRGGGAAGGTVGGLVRGPVDSISITGAAPIVDVQSAVREAVLTADVTQVEDFFEYKFPFPVRLASRQSALLPFLQRTLNVERLSIFNAGMDRGNPRTGAYLENATDIPFEAGPVTFFESGRYAGEAVLDYLSRGEKRLVSYGIDHDVQIAARNRNEPETTTRFTVSRGVAVLYRETVVNTTYEIRNKGSRKTLVLEHPRVATRTLKGSVPWETTERFYRFKVTLDPNQETQLPVTEIVTLESRLSLNSLNRDQLVLLSAVESPQSVRERLAQIVNLQEEIGRLQLERGAVTTGIEFLRQDQERLRENIKALQSSREDQTLRRRYLEQLTKQEDEIEASRVRMSTVNRDITAAAQRLDDLISNLSWGV